MTTALASLDDLEARMGTVADEARALAAIDDASNLIHTVTNSAWLDDGALIESVPSIAVTICCSVARRVLENPAGITSETLGPFSQSVSNSTADVYLTTSEQRLLRRATGGSAVGSVTLESPYPLRGADSDVYVPWVDETSEAFPMGPFPASTA
jgi:hypothetical protein